MSALALAAGLLAAALLMAPAPPGGRLRAARRRRREPRIAIWLVLPLAAGIAIWAPPTLALAVAVLIAVADRRRRRWAAARRRRDESRALTAGLEVLVGELGVGAHPVRAFSVAAAESRGGVGDSLRAVATRAQLGADVSAGLRSAAANSAVPAYWDRLAICWIVAAEHGLSMSTLIRAAHRDIVDRQRFADRVQAGLAGARATATILAGLPILGVALGELIGADPVRFLLGGAWGGWLLLVGVGLIGSGVTWANRIIDRLTP
jgi:tight adherence protein B